MRINTIKSICLGVIFIITAGMLMSLPLSAQATTEKGDILNNDKVSIPSSDDVAESKYAVIAQFIRGTSKLEYSGPKRKMSKNNRALVVEPADSQKGKIRAKYTNIGTYKGRTLDFELVAADWEKAGFLGGEFMHFYTTHIGFNQGGYASVSLEGTYIYADTGKPATDLPGSYMTVNDLDANQFLGFSKSMYNKIDKMYAYEDSWVSLWKVGNKTNIGARFHDALESDDKRGFVTFLVDGYQFNFDWQKDWTRVSSNNNHYNLDRVLDWYDEGSAQYFGYRAEKPIRTEVLEPTKTIVNSAGNSVEENAVTGGDSYSYNLFHSVPAEYPEFFYKSYKLEDKIDESLDIKDIKVYDRSDVDVTNSFTITKDNNLVSIAGKKNKINKKSFYGNDYKFVIDVKVKDPEELIWITKGESSYKFNNKASISTNNGVKDTNTVKTTINYSPGDLMIKRCHVPKDDDKKIIETASGITSNEVNVTEGFFPDGFNSPVVGKDEYRNDSFYMLESSDKRPQVGWSESSWNTWRDKFENGSTKTNKIGLEGITSELQKHGGVLNVTRTHQTSEIEVLLCQNQQKIPDYSKNEWDWKDIEGKEVHKIISIEYNINDKKEQDSYQILGVNCNVDGFESVKEELNSEGKFEIEDHSYDLTSKASRLIIVRPKSPGVPFPLGKPEHDTGKNVFYNPDGEIWKNSCEADFSNACKSTKLSGGSNDANNNLSGDKDISDNKTFSKVNSKGNDENGNSFPNDDNQLVFFRDNEEKQLRADVWYLDIDNPSYSADKRSSAEVTDIKVFSGSPEIGVTEISPIIGKDINENNQEQIDEMNKDFPFDDKHINRISVKSKWSSARDNPLKIGISWTYKAKATNIGFSEIDGYGGLEKEESTNDFQALCSFHNEPGNYQAVIPRGNIFKDGKIDKRDKWNFSETMEILFTRATSSPLTKERFMEEEER